MDVALASKAFPSPSGATTEQPISKRDKAIVDDISSKHTNLHPNANDVSHLLLSAEYIMLKNIGDLVAE